MKKELIISIVLVAVVVGGILLSMQKKPITPSAPQVVPAEPATKPAITKEEVSKHNTKNDCWVIVGGNVYNVTSYIPNHPAGPEVIISVCGQDATTLFTSRNGKGPHPEKAQAALNTMLLGPVK